MTMEIVGPCEPCQKLDAIRPGLRKILDGQRGMLAIVLNGGAIKVGDAHFRRALGGGLLQLVKPSIAGRRRFFGRAMFREPGLHFPQVAAGVQPAPACWSLSSMRRLKFLTLAPEQKDGSVPVNRSPAGPSTSNCQGLVHLSGISVRALRVGGSFVIINTPSVSVIV